ncbi:MAG: DUF429 domain-containing protein [Alphaproteobacteria bacterium]
MNKRLKSVAGVDGCRGGWIMVRKDPARDDVSVHIATNWRDLPPTDMIAVDMPIGLPNRGARGCDRLAQTLLGARRSSVFLGFRRPLLNFADYPSANAWGKRIDGKGLAKQAWFLLPKIRELDEILTPPLQARIRECHPELAFASLAGAPMRYAKRDPRGERARMKALRAAGFGELPHWLKALDRRLAKPDDLLDACVLCWQAERLVRGTAKRLPHRPQRDAHGLRMEIWY